MGRPGREALVADALRTGANLQPAGPTSRPLVRADSAFYGSARVGAALRGGVDVSITVRLDRHVKATITSIPDDACNTIEYTDAIYDQPGVSSGACGAVCGGSGWSGPLWSAPFPARRR